MVSFPPRLSTDQGWGESFYINDGLVTETVIPGALKSKKMTEQGCELHEGRACVCFIHWCTPTRYPRRAPSICIEWTLNEWVLSGSHHAINSHSISHQVESNHFPTEPSYSGHLPSFAPSMQSTILKHLIFPLGSFRCGLFSGGGSGECLPLRNQRGQMLFLGTLNNCCKNVGWLEAIHCRAGVASGSHASALSLAILTSASSLPALSGPVHFPALDF